MEHLGPIMILSPTLSVDLLEHVIQRKCHTFYLPPCAWSVLLYLLQHPNQLIPSTVLVAVAWPNEPGHGAPDLYRHIHRIREAIEPAPHHPCWLISRRGVGYKLRLSNPAPMSDR